VLLADEVDGRFRRTGAAEHDIPAELRGALDGRADGVAAVASASAR